LQQFNFFFLKLSKLLTIVEIFPFAITMKKDDLFCLDETHEEWKKIIQKVEFKRLGTNVEL